MVLPTGSDNSSTTNDAPEHSAHPSHIAGHLHFVDHVCGLELHHFLHSASTAKAVVSRAQAKQHKACGNDLVQRSSWLFLGLRMTHGSERIN